MMVLGIPTPIPAWGYPLVSFEPCATRVCGRLFALCTPRHLRYITLSSLRSARCASLAHARLHNARLTAVVKGFSAKPRVSRPSAQTRWNQFSFAEPFVSL